MKLEPLLYVSDLARSIRFYTDLLGFELGDLFPDTLNPTYAPVFIGDSKLMLCLQRDSNRRFAPHGLGGSGVHLFVRVDDVDAIYARLRDQANVIDELQTRRWGDREFSLRDPDGYVIAFYSPS